MLIIAVTCCASVTLVMSLILCICWGKKTPKDEWQGLDGMVTQKNPDENVNHLPSAASCDGDSTNASGVSNDKRNVVTNTRRSLPDIPAEQVAAINWDPTGDNSSEHYATVGHYQNAAKRHTVPDGGPQRPSVSQHSSISQADDTFSPYERVKYDKIDSKQEHPYARLQPTTSRQAAVEEEGDGSEERINLLRADVTVSTVDLPPTRSRRSSAHSGGGLDIPAASAVAGVVAASPDLPYMTPPPVMPAPAQAPAQDHFSGDSQDSSKGYTSISVREPLANIMAQSKEINKKKRELDPHYSTVSDDSDDVYTTIPDPNNPIYGGESETYARIPVPPQPPPVTVEAEVNAPPALLAAAPLEDRGDSANEPPEVHGPPGGHAKTHSRQASSSSSIANLGSPKPEKRQANSPLPPPPTTATNFDFHAVKNLDDLYAKVRKNKGKEDAAADRSEKVAGSPESIGRSSRTSLEFKTPEKKSRGGGGGGGDHDYETLKKSPKGAGDPGYEKIKGTEEEPGYASINGPSSMSSSDPGYEVLKAATGGATVTTVVSVNATSDPNYEELRHRPSDASDCSAYAKIRDLDDGYSVVKKRRSDGKRLSIAGDGCDEPNYESMPTSEVRSNGSESDPNYESVGQSDPNYETVHEGGEPPYERLDEDSSRTNNSSSDCEKVRENGLENDTSDGKSSSDRTEPPYERLDGDLDDSESPGYERIRAKVTELSSDVLEEDGIVQDKTPLIDDNGEVVQ